jgi:hypothetical protein
MATRYFGSEAPTEVLIAKARLYSNPRKLFSEFSAAEETQRIHDRAVCDSYEEWIRKEYDRDGFEIVKAPWVTP